LCPCCRRSSVITIASVGSNNRMASCGTVGSSEECRTTAQRTASKHRASVNECHHASGSRRRYHSGERDCLPRSGRIEVRRKCSNCANDPVAVWISWSDNERQVDPHRG
jgi:hypothetical protein